MPGRLLEGVGEPSRRRLAPGAADEREPDRQAGDEPRRDGDARVAGHGGRRRAAADVVVAVHEVDQPGGAAVGATSASSRCSLDDRVEPSARESAAAGRERLAVGGVGERALRLGAWSKSSWPKNGISCGGVGLVERDAHRQQRARHAAAERARYGVEVGLELVEQDLELAVVEVAAFGHVRRVDQLGAEAAHACRGRAIEQIHAGSTRSLRQRRAMPREPRRRSRLGRGQPRRGSAGRVDPRRPASPEAGRPRRRPIAPSGRPCPGCARWG